MSFIAVVVKMILVEVVIIGEGLREDLREGLREDRRLGDRKLGDHMLEDRNLEDLGGDRN